MPKIFTLVNGATPYIYSFHINNFKNFIPDAKNRSTGNADF